MYKIIGIFLCKIPVKKCLTNIAGRGIMEFWRGGEVKRTPPRHQMKAEPEEGPALQGKEDFSIFSLLMGGNRICTCPNRHLCVRVSTCSRPCNHHNIFFQPLSHWRGGQLERLVSLTILRSVLRLLPRYLLDTVNLAE